MIRPLGLVLVTLICACGSSERGDRRAFLIAAEAGDTAGVRRELEAGVGPDDVFNRNDPTALYLASINGNVEVVRVLLEAGADPTAKFKGASLRTEILGFRERLRRIHEDPEATTGTYLKQDRTTVGLRDMPFRDEAYDRILELIEEAAKKREAK
jgi:hypothetical protein